MTYREVSKEYIRHAADLFSNPGQLAAYNSTQHCVVLAGPGSGKTKTLVLKLARMLAEDVKRPHGIACITYSQECARELGRRLEVLGLRDVPNLYVGTIHGFCLKHILMPYAHLAGLPIPHPITLATSQQMDTAFKRASENVLGIGNHASIHDASKYRRTYLNRNDPSWYTDAEMASISENYEALLRQQGLVDFDDLVVLGNQLVSEHDWILPLIAAKFPILTIDEYQDLGIPLHRIVMRLVFDAGVRLFAVGDADQSVYGFAGADGDLLLELAQRQDVEEVKLLLNYRSAGEIIRASELVLQETRGYQPSDDTRQATIQFVERPSGLADQANYIMQHVIPTVLAAKQGRKIGDIAVLYRTAKIGDEVANAAIAAGYKFIRVDNEAPYKKVGLTSWIEDCAAWCAGGWKTGKPKLNGLIRRWLGFQSGRPGERLSRLETVRLTQFLVAHQNNGSMPASLFVTDIISELIGPLVSEEPSLSDQYEQVSRMALSLASGGKLENLDVNSLGGRDGSPEHLNLLTLHSAKGCEFDVVIMIGMDQGAMPWANESGEQLKESRRLFYVGLTRARDAVYMLYSGWITGRYGAQRLGRSVFLEELSSRLGI